MRSEEIREALADLPPALSLFSEHGTDDFAKCIDIANLCCAARKYDVAVIFFEAALSHNRDSKHVLLAKLKCQLDANTVLSLFETDHLRMLDPLFADYLSVLIDYRRGLPQEKKLPMLRKLGPAIEAFATGAEPDWLYLRLASDLIQVSAPQLGQPSHIPRNLFMYWDKNTPQYVERNVQYHRDLSYFDVKFYNRDAAAELIRDYFGYDCRKVFLHLRHPSEESDFFRWHAIFAHGGYYLDADDQLLSLEAFEKQSLSPHDAIFFLSASGPIRAGYFGATRHHPVVAECLRVIMLNCINHPNLSMWLKTGPGVASRAITRSYHRALFWGEATPSMLLRGEHDIALVLRQLPVDYRTDARDWRFFESQQG